MVRTRRSMEEEARVHRIGGMGTDTWLADEDLTEAIEGRTVEALLEWGRDNVRRALVVGLEDRGRIALELAKAGVFVTVVEPDEALHEPVKAKADEAKCSIRLSIFASDYMERNFASSGFDLAVFYSVLSRYNEPIIVLKKASRELRAGGRVFARIRVRPPMDKALKYLEKIPKSDVVLEKLSEFVARIPALNSYTAFPDVGTFLKELEGVFKVERVERLHLLAPVAGHIAGRGGVMAGVVRLLGPLTRLDEAVLKIPNVNSAATHLVVFGTKELGLGKTFSVGH